MKPLVAAVAVLVATSCGGAERDLAETSSPALETTDTLRARAEQGDAEAQVNLGFRYATGEGVPQDAADAVRWFRLAADQGHAEAMTNLGAMYSQGRGVVQDYVQSHMWRNLAASRQTGEDRELSVKARDAVASFMTADDLSEAQRLAREWDEAHPR